MTLTQEQADKAKEILEEWEIKRKESQELLIDLHKAAGSPKFGNYGRDAWKIIHDESAFAMVIRAYLNSGIYWEDGGF